MIRLNAVMLVLPVSGCLLVGCAVGPDYRSPEMHTPEAWDQGAEFNSSDGDIQQWWHVFNDDTLTSLIARAAQGNLDLRMAVLRIRQARAIRGVAAGELLPSLSGRSSYERGKASANGQFGATPAAPGAGRQFAETVTRGAATSAIAQGITSAAPGASALASPLASGITGLVPQRTGLSDTPETDLFSSGFDASWELDIFGGIRRNIEAAHDDVDVAVEDYHAVLVSLFGEVATTYIDLRTLQAEIATTKRNIELQRETLALTQSQLRYKLGSELEVQQAATNLSTTESQLPLLEADFATAIYRLSVLIGREPTALKNELIAMQVIPQTPGEVFVGVPADVLRRRPDIRASERRLAAETARIGVATADLYPRFTLSGTFGFEASSFDHVVDSRSVAYGLGPSVRWNIFDGLRNLNRIAAQEDTAHQAYVAYEQAVLIALQDVESSMVYYKQEQARREALKQATDNARRTVDLAQTRYEDGLTDFQDVVDAERTLVDLETALVRSEGQVAVNLVSLYKALGGGWKPGVTTQNALLNQPSPALDKPLKYFLSGGSNDLPWETAPKTDAAREAKTNDDE